MSSPARRRPVRTLWTWIRRAFGYFFGLQLRILALVLLTMPLWAPLNVRREIAEVVVADFESTTVSATVVGVASRSVSLRLNAEVDSRASLLWNNLVEQERSANGTVKLRVGRLDTNKISEILPVRISPIEVTQEWLWPRRTRISKWIVWGVAFVGLLMVCWCADRSRSRRSGIGRELMLGGLLVLGSAVFLAWTTWAHGQAVRKTLSADFETTIAQVESVFQDETIELPVAVLRPPQTLQRESRQAWDAAIANWDEAGRGTTGGGRVRVTCPPGKVVVAGDAVQVQFNQFGARFAGVDYSQWAGIPLMWSMLLVAVGMLAAAGVLGVRDRPKEPLAREVA